MQSIRLDVDLSKGISEEVEKALDMSLNQIYPYRCDGGRILIIGQTTDYGGVGVTESLSSELKKIGRIIFFYCVVNCCLYVQSKSLRKILEQVYGAGGIGEVSFVQLLHTFWSTQEALVEDFKDT